MANTLGPHIALHFRGHQWGTAQEDVTEGPLEATPLYCLAWHRYVREVKATLRPVGRVTRFVSLGSSITAS